MRTAMLGWFIAGIAVLAFLILWFYTSYRELRDKTRDVKGYRKPGKKAQAFADAGARRRV